MKTEYIIIIPIWIFIMGLATSAILIADYYSTPQRLYFDGGTIINSTLINNDYQFNYFDGQEIKQGQTVYKVESGDQLIIYNVGDTVNIPYIYQPRVWREVYLNNDMIETNENHVPLAWLIVLFIGNSIVLIISIVKYERRKNAKP